jgi:hypothetical protein
MTDQVQTESAPAPASPWGLSPEQATAALDRMTKDFQASKKSADPVASRYAPDKPHRLDKLMAGNKAEGEKFAGIVQDKIAADAASPERRDAAAITDILTEAGLSPSIDPAGAEVEEYISGKRSITPQLRAAVDAKIEVWKRDTEFQRKLFSGDSEAKRLLGIAMGMRQAPVEAA